MTYIILIETFSSSSYHHHHHHHTNTYHHHHHQQQHYHHHHNYHHHHHQQQQHYYHHHLDTCSAIQLHRWRSTCQLQPSGDHYRWDEIDIIEWLLNINRGSFDDGDEGSMYICVSITKTVTSTDNYQLIDDTNLDRWVLMLQLLGVIRQGRYVCRDEEMVR